MIPSRFEEASPTRAVTGTDVAPVFVMADHLQGTAPTLYELALGAVQPLNCPQLSGNTPPSARYNDDVNALAATWTRLADPTAAQESGKSLSPSEAANLVHQFRTCTYPFTS